MRTRAQLAHCATASKRAPHARLIAGKQAGSRRPR